MNSNKEQREEVESETTETDGAEQASTASGGDSLDLEDLDLTVETVEERIIARVARNEALYDRESRERDELLHMLAAEETYYDGKVELLERRIEHGT